jgi:phage antirepressor YoqD-like protein
MVAERLDDDEKGVSMIYTPGGNQETTIINESGLYNVILRSDKPNAKKFKKWITSEVLPSIRKTGKYAVPSSIPVINADFLQRIADKLREHERLILEMKPKAEYFDDLVDRQNNLNFRDTAKELGISEKKFIDWLLTKGFVYRDGSKQLKPYSEALHDGLFVLKEWVRGKMTGVQTLITVSGRDRFYQLLQRKQSILEIK